MIENKIHLNISEYSNRDKKNSLIKNIDNSNIINISKYILCNYFDLTKDKDIKIQDEELYKLVIPQDIADRLLKGELDFLKDKSGLQLASIFDRDRKKIVANARFEKAEMPILNENMNKDVNSLIMQNMLYEISHKLDKIDMKLDKLLEIEDDKVKSEITSSINMYNQAMECKDENLKKGILLNIITKLNTGMDRSLHSLKNSVDIIDNLPNNSFLRSIRMSIPTNKYSKENILNELENVYNKVQLIYMGTGLLSSVYLEMQESDNVVNQAKVYLEEMLSYLENRNIYSFIDNKNVQDTIEASFSVIDTINWNQNILDKKADLCINMSGKNILELTDKGSE